MIQELRHPVSPLHDLHGRHLEYLRLSLTDVCNFRCSYCLPDGYRKPKHAPAPLSLEEICRLVRGFATVGLWKIRLTGGEPTLRAGFEDIAATIAAVPGISRVAMTTNGYRLSERAGAYRAAGITAINVSIDSLIPDRFSAITGHDRLSEVLAGLDAARAAGFDCIKVNTVLMRDVNDDELDAIVDFVAGKDISLRFIEVMRTNDNPDFFTRHHLPGASVASRLERCGWSRIAHQAGAGPAIEYVHPDATGRIGIIAPYSRDFCASCNRVRVSASGRLHLCLFGDGSVDLRPLLRSDDQYDELVNRIRCLTYGKPSAHRLHSGNSGTTPHLASIGG